MGEPYLRGASFHRSKTNPLTKEANSNQDDPHENLDSHLPAKAARQMRHRIEDHHTKAVHKGTLWKLNLGKDAMDEKEWLQRDMWIANNHSLCYYSQAEGKRLVYLDSHHLHGAEITELRRA